MVHRILVKRIIILLFVPVIVALAGLWNHGLAQTATLSHQTGYESGTSPLALPGDYKGYTWNASALAVAKASAQSKGALPSQEGSLSSANKTEPGSDQSNLQTKERALVKDKMKVPEPDMLFLLPIALGGLAFLKRSLTRA